MSKIVIQAVESVQDELSARIGRSYGHQTGVADRTITLQGSFSLALAYAALFFPIIQIRNGIPMARFATEADDVPLDCFHVTLVHHEATGGGSPSMCSALGNVLAEAWNLALDRQGLPGRFVHSNSTGDDVVYKLEVQ